MLADVKIILDDRLLVCMEKLESSGDGGEVTLSDLMKLCKVP